MKIEGVWLPVVTPFNHGELDRESYTSLVRHYLACGISGLIPLGTTGENSCISEKEYDYLVNLTLEIAQKKVPVFVGCGGNNTSKVVRDVKKLEESGIKVPVNLDQDKISKIIGLLEDLSYVCDELDDYDRRKEASLYFRPGVH